MGEVALREEFSVQTSKHEVVIKFPRGQKELILDLLQKHSFVDVKQTISRDGYCFAYCLYNGDIRELDTQLKDLESKALLSIGERTEGENTFLEFFLPSGDLLPASHIPVRTQPGKMERMGNLIYTVIFLILTFVAGIAFNGYLPITKIAASLTSSSPSLATESVANIPIIPASWGKYVAPECQPAWWRIKKDLFLDGTIMTRLFERIKSTDDSGYSRTLDDLTIYPETIRRALDLVVFQNVKDFDQLQALINELKSRYFYSQSFPDQSKTFINASDRSQSGNAVILAFYRVILKDPTFASSLLNNLWEGQG